MAANQRGASRQRTENAPAANPRTPPRVDNATDAHTLTHATGRGSQTTSNIGHRSAEPGSNRVDADENGGDRGKLDTSRQFGENPLTTGVERMQQRRAQGRGDHV